MIGLSISLVFILLLVWVLFAPMLIRIDTNQGLYLIQWLGIIQARLIFLADDLLIQLQVGFWKKQFYPLHSQVKKEPKKESPKKQQPKKPQSKNFRKWSTKISRVFKSFKIKGFRLNLDTDDFIYNSYLWPIFYFLSKDDKKLNINYEGDFELLFIAQNRLFRILRALFL